MRVAVQGVGPRLREAYPPDAQADAVMASLINRLKAIDDTPSQVERKIEDLAARLEELPAAKKEGGE